MKLLYYLGEGLNPYRNLAIEQYLLEITGDDTCILYLWQNDNTVVIGRNQNCWKECRTEEIKKDGCRIARRLSGGGAVFHDMGNLNFTFLVRSAGYDLGKQLSVIAAACRSLGLDARPTGRNDITIDDRKFSGNAFYQYGDKRYHHGTILISADMTKLAGYLNVSRDKLQSKGVTSVKARVVNLAELNPSITVDIMREALIIAFGQIYEGTPLQMDASEFNNKRIEELTARNSSWEWNYGSDMAFTFEIAGRFDWGGIEIKIDAKNGIVSDSIVYSDMMDWEAAGKIRQALIGCRFDSEIMASAVSAIPAISAIPAGTADASVSVSLHDDVYSDIAALIRAQEV
jgi:lipoate-protein ligase A